jgi:hypothetical protein
MLSKIIVSTAFCLAQNAHAQDDDSVTLTTIPEDDIPEGPLGTELGLETTAETSDGVEPAE